MAKTPESQRKYLTTVKSKAEELEAMVSRILTYSRLDMENASRNVIPVCLDRYLQSEVAALAPDYAERGLEMTARTEPFTVTADISELHQLFLNIADNSLKNKNREYELLLYLMINVDMVFSREQLYERIWGFDAMGDSVTVVVHINRLRDKLEKEPAKPRYIQTVWGAGYRFKA